MLLRGLGPEIRMLTCETELVEVILPCDWAVGDAIHERSQHWASASLVDTKDVWAWRGWCWRMVRVRFCKW